MKHLLVITAIVETGTGIALLALPSAMGQLLLGVSLEAGASQVIARILGAALFAIGAACWVASGEVESRAARGLVAAMLFYNLAAASLFLQARIGLRMSGLGLWPAIVLHGALAVRCGDGLRNRSGRPHRDPEA